MKPTNPVFTGLPTTIFEVMSGLARQHQAVNLGQGFPDSDGPLEIRQVAADYLIHGSNQYPPMLGLPDLRQAVAEANRRFYGLEVDWQSEVMVTSGATEALGDCILGLVSPGDEVIVIEPFYDSYIPMIRAAGATPVRIRLTPPDWSLPLQDLARAFGPKTKAIILNDPMNPTGKVFTHAELQAIADLVIAHDAYVIADEVYEHLTFDGKRHETLLAFPGMRGRVARVGSAGKTFSLTGWKIGYVTAAPELLGPIAKAHQFVTFTTAPNLQAGVAHGLRLGDAYYHDLAARMQASRDRLSAGLKRLGFRVLPCHGTYFVTTDTAPLGAGRDFDLAQTMVKEGGVACVPVSAFYEDNPPTDYIRFCFCKSDSVIDAGLERLESWLK